MKKFKFLWLPLFAIVGLAGIYLLSCQHDADQLTLKPLSDTPVTERACTSGDYCEFTVTATTDANVEFCGDIDPSTGTCSYGCLPNTDFSLSASLTADIPYTICVLKTGSVCIRNSPTATQSINVTVYFGSSSSLNVMLSPGQSHCFHSNGQCSVTSDGCI
ncbi:MAG: hypothetical protein EPGJADBJ_05298 [Saprospiraceae bacterium]|nr:hypothetical protein [Saprospiraceae bacterium]